MRDIRARIDRSGKKATGLDLTVGLERYSEKGMEYVYLLQNIIRHNNMEMFDTTKLIATAPSKHMSLSDTDLKDKEI